MDMGRCLIPKPEKKYMIEQGLFYYYIELEKVAIDILIFYLKMMYDAEKKGESIR